ncbi:22666_t:CDS:1, partial [Rhizophagus irregularis]
NQDENLEQKENEFISKDGLNVSDWDDADNVDEVNKENNDLDEEEANDSRTEEAKDDFY